jgi:predicted RNase H-like HicB family nuclease
MSRWNPASDIGVLLPTHRERVAGDEKSLNLSILLREEPSAKSGKGWQPCPFVLANPFQGSSEVVTGWETAVAKLLATWGTQYEHTLQTDLRFNLLEKVVVQLKNRISRLESKTSVLVPIQMFDSMEFSVQHPFLAVVQPDEDGFNATFFDANIGTSGDTQDEAVANLKDLILITFEQFESLEHENKLGPEPARQLSVLRKVIKRAT